MSQSQENGGFITEPIFTISGELLFSFYSPPFNLYRDQIELIQNYHFIINKVKHVKCQKLSWLELPTNTKIKTTPFDDKLIFFENCLNSLIPKYQELEFQLLTELNIEKTYYSLKQHYNFIVRAWNHEQITKKLREYFIALGEYAFDPTINGGLIREIQTRIDHLVKLDNSERKWYSSHVDYLLEITNGPSDVIDPEGNHEDLEYLQDGIEPDSDESIISGVSKIIL
jgi:hypothetical protein